MAVEQKSRHAITRLADVFPAHRRRVIIYAVFLETAVLISMTGLLLYLQINLLTIAIAVLLPTIVLQTFALNLIASYALEPLDFLSRTVTEVSDQPHDTTPPNLNGTRHERTGFKLMVDTIYGLALREPATAVAPASSVEAALLDKLPGGVVALDASRVILYANPLAPVILDQNGMREFQLQWEGEDTLNSWLENVEATQVSGLKLWRRIATSTVGEPGRRVFDIAASYQKNGANGIDTLLLFFDQTDRYSVTEESMDFIALAAHELRGPITVIRGYLDVLRPELEAVLNDDQRRLFDRLDVSSSRLGGYVNNVLNASKYDRRHLKLHLHEDRLTDVYDLVSDDLQLRASTQGRLLAVSLPDNLPTIVADRSSLSEVVMNLVDNAIKYSQEGGQVNVTAGVDGNMVRFSVQDHGVGMPASVIGNLFTKFYRSHRSKSTVSGTGLGLYISKAIVESHGGKMSVNSVDGQGSTFSFSVPIYSTVKDKLLAEQQGNQGIIETSGGWIKNHSMYRG